jgi:hypothetical protein
MVVSVMRLPVGVANERVARDAETVSVLPLGLESSSSGGEMTTGGAACESPKVAPDAFTASITAAKA